MSFAFWMLLASCGKVQQPEFRSLDNFGVKNVSLQEATIGFEMTYFNPNNFGVAVKEADIDVYVDSVYMGKFTQPQLVDVGSSAEFSIPMEGRISWREAIRSNLHKRAGKEVQVRAEGTVKVGKGGVFVNKDIRYSGHHTLDLELLKNPAGAGF
ncbi:MAG: LEA type 2 family protein [Chitinophagaceae bacterium]